MYSLMHCIRSVPCYAQQQMKLLMRECLIFLASPLWDVPSHLAWVKPGPIYVRNQPRRSKNDPIVSPATLIHANLEYAHVRLQSGIETTVNLRDIAQHPDTVERNIDFVPRVDENVEVDTVNIQNQNNEPPNIEQSASPPEASTNDINTSSTEPVTPCRTTPVSRLPKRFDDYVLK